MAAPKFAPMPPADQPRAYASPDHVPEAWQPGRPGELDGPQPRGAMLGSQGPDQGYALTLAERMRPKLQPADGEHVDDAIRGCVAIALRRASLYGRAPVIHDLTIAATIWGWLDADPPAELLAERRRRFEGLRQVTHHYTETRALADLVPEATLRSTPQAVASRYPAEWRALTGV